MLPSSGPGLITTSVTFFPTAGRGLQDNTRVQNRLPHVGDKVQHKRCYAGKLGVIFTRAVEPT